MFIDYFEIGKDELIAHTHENPELEKEIDKLCAEAMKKWEEDMKKLEEMQKEAITKAGYVMKCNQILKEVEGFRNV